MERKILMCKKSLFISIIIILIIVIVMGVTILSNGGYWFIGNVWYDTPEVALQYESDKNLESQKTLTIKKIINKHEIDDITIITFVSQNDTLVMVTFVTNKDGLYSVYGYTEEMFLDTPTEFVVTGDEKQFVLFPYNTYNNTIYGWCYSNITPMVNKMVPIVQTYDFEFQGEKWSLNFWYFNESHETTNNIIDFVEHKRDG